jgi:hypothetical protein
MRRSPLWIRQSPLVVTLATAIATVASAADIDFTVTRELGFRSFKPIYVAIDSKMDWATFWKTRNTDSISDTPVANAMPVPEIDFQKSTLLVASVGSKPNLSYTVSIGSVFEEPDLVRVTVFDIGPDDNCPRLQAMSNPVTFALIAKTTKPIKFILRTAIADCGQKNH